MAKIILSPLFIVLVVLLPLQLWLLVKSWKGKRFRAICITAFTLVLSITFLSLSNVNYSLCKALELGTSYTFSCPQDAVVVLGGGFYSSIDGSRDELNGESSLRVIKGVEVFKKCNARWLVVSGRLKTGIKEMHGELMRDLAISMGIPKDRILMETDSTNTREHPVYLKEMGYFDAGSRLAIVTSPWHLKRAMVEFNRYFPLSVPVAAYDISPNYSFSLSGWLPQAGILDSSTTMIHEYIGMMWYDILNKFPSLRY